MDQITISHSLPRSLSMEDEKLKRKLFFIACWLIIASDAHLLGGRLIRFVPPMIQLSVFIVALQQQMRRSRSLCTKVAGRVYRMRLAAAESMIIWESVTETD